MERPANPDPLEQSRMLLEARRIALLGVLNDAPIHRREALENELVRTENSLYDLYIALGRPVEFYVWRTTEDGC